MANHRANHRSNHRATRRILQMRDVRQLRLDPCHLPQSISYIAQKSGVMLTGQLNECSILIRAGKGAKEDGSLKKDAVVQILSPQHFRGVAARRIETADGQKAISLVLLHKNADYSIPLLISRNHDDVLLDWRLWSDIYDLPMLLMDTNGIISNVRECSPLKRFITKKAGKTHSGFLLRCRGRSLNVRLVIANQVMLG